MFDLPPPYSPRSSPAPLHADDRSPRMNRATLDQINPYTFTGDASGHHPESSTFAMMRERENRELERERMRAVALIQAEALPPPSYPGRSMTPPLSISNSLLFHDQVDPYPSDSPAPPPPADPSRPSPSDRERARLLRLQSRSTSPSGARLQSAPASTSAHPFSFPAPSYTPARQPARHADVDPYELPILQRSTTSTGPIRGITPQQRELERLERLRLRDATRRVARTLGTSLSGQAARQTPHDDVDPYALAEAIEASMRERQRALDRLQAISPQQRESERLERIRSRDAARASMSNATSRTGRMRIATSSCESLAGGSRRMGSGRVSAV